MKARRLLVKGCQGYIAHVTDARVCSENIQQIPIVKEFIDVFPEDLPSLPPHRETDFEIETIPGVAPISIVPYKMAPLELKELKK